MNKYLTDIFGAALLAIAFAACGGASSSTNSGAAETVLPVGALMTEYKNSKEATVKKYAGKTLTVRGYTAIAPLLPTGADDAGILVLGEKGGDLMLSLSCQFTAAEKATFAEITGDEMVTVRGVFSDDTSTGLKSCKIVETK